MRLISRTTKLQNPIFGVDSMVVETSGGKRFRRMVVTHQGSAVVLPMNAQGEVLLVRQWRAPLGEQIWELPAGRVDDGETALQAARRELLEETGLRAKRWRRLGIVHPSPGYVAERMHLYLATDLTYGAACPEADEDITTRWFSRAELEQKIDKGRLTDGKTLAGLLLAWRRPPTA
jgi:ADP-ribose pyrophosphatase